VNLDADTALTAQETGRYRAELSPNWTVWGVNGGYLAAVALRAAGESAAWDAPAAMSVNFLNRPRPGIADVSVDVLRRTSKAECRRVEIVQGGTPILSGVVWCTADGLRGNEPEPRTVPAPEGVPSRLERLGNNPAGLLPWQAAIEDRPLFFPDDWPDNWETRQPSEPHYEAWFRYRPAAVFGSPWVNAARVLIISDIYPVFGYVQARRGLELTCRAATIFLSVQFHRPTDEEEFLFGDCRVLGAAQGLLGTSTSVWNRDGKCCATAIQQNLLLA
jgi:acyl-CoA thioesterase